MILHNIVRTDLVEMFLNPFVSPSSLVHPSLETIECQIYIIDPAQFPPGPEMPTNNLDDDPAYPVPKDHSDVPVGIPVYNHK